MHLAAFKSLNRACELLIMYVLKTGPFERADKDTQDKKQTLARRLKLRTWINQQTNGEDSFTPLHFASFHGNLHLIRLLIKYGANIRAENRSGVNMIHVAAQGD